jgi:hypothetical protein
MNLTIPDPNESMQDRIHKEKVVAAVSCHSSDESEKLYGFLKISLVDINNWKEFGSGKHFESKITDQTGSTVLRFAKAGDLIKTNLTRRQSSERLYDWMEIKTIEEKLYGPTEIFFITISPVINPETDVPYPSLFMQPSGNVTLFVIRDDRKIELLVHDHSRTFRHRFFGIRDGLRHAFNFLFAGSRLHEMQWSGLLKSILKAGKTRLSVSDY